MRTDVRASWWGGVLPTVVLPVVVGLVTLVGTGFAEQAGTGLRPLDLLGRVLLLAGPAALVVRRWNPPVVFAGVGAVLLGYLAAGYPFGPVPLATFVALGSTVARGHRRPGYAIAAVVFAGVVVAHVLRHPGSGFPLAGASAWLAWVAAYVTAAELWRARRDRREQARAAADEAERRRGSEERLRIARDLHDVLGHHVSLINVQAGVALYLMDDDPEQARSALTAIKQSSRDLLREMRSTLGVLRGVDEDPPRDAVAGLARVDDLLEATRAAGLPVTVQIDGEPRALPPSVDTAAYRIMQEALTNARKHAGPARASVLLTYTEDGLDMRIDDDGTGPAGDPGGGNGLPGMRERAAALGGTLTAGPRPGGGFRVDAHLLANGADR
ncbi:sensor histidine kinase [Pseudonocardia kunmingensis]|uniref:sensor histidine kinase n=1 Tax=Pseudonocardia kunmingensis TaxID=630975 RepID=UPI0014787709|nr:sensor histidine kinase [Pseudonocardia kunmingensis]